MDLLGHPNMNGGTPASAAVNGVLLRTPEEFAQKTAECARLSREKAPQDVFERAARDKQQYDAIHEAYYRQFLEDKRREEAQYDVREVVRPLMLSPTSGRSESSDVAPSWVSTDDDTTS
jgi:hypothetical protein